MKHRCCLPVPSVLDAEEGEPVMWRCPCGTLYRLNPIVRLWYRVPLTYSPA